MILADTTIWVDHLRHVDQHLQELLDAGQVVMHPFIIGELALGHIRQRKLILATLEQMPAVHIADPEEVLLMIEHWQLVAMGIGYVDTHLLASTLTTPDCRLWTRDGRLGKTAARLGIAAEGAN